MRVCERNNKHFQCLIFTECEKTLFLQISYKILSKYIIFTVLLDELEHNSREPITDMVNWSPLYLSTHVLRQLDKIIPKLKTEKLSNYFFKNSNLLVNPGHLTDDDFAAEAINVKSLLLRYFDESLMSTIGKKQYKSFVQICR